VILATGCYWRSCIVSDKYTQYNCEYDCQCDSSYFAGCLQLMGIQLLLLLEMLIREIFNQVWFKAMAL